MAGSGVLPANGTQLYDVPVYNAQVPKEGPKVCPVVAPFAPGGPTSYSVNLLLTQSQQFMSLVQAAWVDNAANGQVVVISCSETQHSVTVPPGYQGTVPLLVAKNGNLTIASEGGVPVKVLLLNVPVPAALWPVAGVGGGNQAVAVPASSATVALGTSGGALGDYLDGLLVIPATTSPGAVAIKDGSATAISVFTGGAASVPSLIPFFVPVQANSAAGAWQVTTGANVSVLALGRFT